MKLHDSSSCNLYSYFMLLSISTFLPSWLVHSNSIIQYTSMSPPSPSFSLAESLLHYSTPGVAPPSSRVDPKLKLQPRTPLRMWDYWKFAALVASKGPSSPIDTYHSNDTHLILSDRSYFGCSFSSYMGPKAQILGHRNDYCYKPYPWC